MLVSMGLKALLVAGAASCMIFGPLATCTCADIGLHTPQRRGIRVMLAGGLAGSVTATALHPLDIGDHALVVVV